MRKRILSTVLLIITFASLINIGSINVKAAETEIVGQAMETRTTGNINNVVVFLKFKDQEDPYETGGLYDYLKSNFNGSDKSLKDYLEYASYNQLHVDSSFYPIDEQEKTYAYEAQLSQSYYEPLTSENPNGYSVFNRMERETELLTDAVENIEDQIPDTLNVDHDNDGYVDSVTFVVPEEGEWNSLLWSHQSTIYDETKQLKGKKLGSYAVVTLNSLYSGYGVVSHEYLHILGLPDLYKPEQGEDIIGNYSIMATSYGPLTVYEKEKYGKWVPEIQEINEDGVYELSTSSTDPRDGTIAYKIPVITTLNEEFILEYREPSSSKYDEEIGASGLLIYRVQRDLWGNFYGPPDEITIMSNENIWDAPLNGTEGSDSFNNFKLSDGTGDLGINITDVKKENGKINFRVTLSANDHVSPPKNIRETRNNKESIELTWDTGVYFSDYYTIYRDGELIGTTESTNFIDKLVDAPKNRVYTYTVTSNSRKNGESEHSEPRKVIVTADVGTRTFYYKAEGTFYFQYGDSPIIMEDSIFAGYKVAKIPEEYNGLVYFGVEPYLMVPLILAEGIGDNHIYTFTPNEEGVKFDLGTPIQTPIFKETTIFYKGSFDKAYLNYFQGKEEGVTSTTTIMTNYTEHPEYKTITLALVDSDSTEVYISDGLGNNDNNNGKNYIMEEGNYLINNGKAIKFTGDVLDVKVPVDILPEEKPEEINVEVLSTGTNTPNNIQATNRGVATKTSDNTNYNIWILLAVSMIVIEGIIIKRKKSA